jgi:hypothetical protein
MGQYYILNRNLNKYSIHPVSENPYDVVSEHPEDDWYLSVYFFNEEHKAQFDKQGGPAGIQGATTNRLVFDFDNGEDLEAARKDTVTLIDRLRIHGIPPESFQVCYSGGKGFSVLVKTDSNFNSNELKTVCKNIAGDLPTFDKKIYNDVRVLRLPLTRHQRTGHYKIPIGVNELSSLTIPEIQARATDAEYVSQLSVDDLYMEATTVPESLKVAQHTSKESVIIEEISADGIDWSLKPRWMSNCKYAIYKGLFKEGTRDHFFTVMAATFKTQFPDSKEMVYRMLKTVAENQARVNGGDRFPDKDIWLKVEQVFKPTWLGGTYTCKNDDELKSVCDGLGIHKCEPTTKETEVYGINQVTQIFREYANEIDANTIKTGIAPIDENVRITSGMHIGVLGAPGGGKTSMLLNILNNTSKAGIKSFFFSMDMYAPLIYQKQLHKLTGLSEKQLFNMIKSGDPRLAKYDKELTEEYSNVRFCFKSGLTVEDIRQIVLDHQNETGERIKLIAIDYAECIAGPFSDSFANSKIIAHKLKDLAAQDGFCVLTLVQPPKTAGDASTPLYSMTQVKGPSDWAQGFGIIMGVYREGYNPNYSEDDRFITINSLKNRMGAMFKVDCAWNGLRGTIEPLDEQGELELAELRERKSKSNGDNVSSFNKYGGAFK